MASASRHIPLEHRHIELGAKMVPYNGFLMPVQYTGIKDEHHAVRSHAGLFDVSHMGEVEVRGDRAIEVVDALITNDLSRLEDGQALYSVMCNDAGGIVDDIIVYRLASDHVLICVNAGNRDKDFAHILKHAGDKGVEIINTSDDYAQLALQGPASEQILQPLLKSNLSSLRAFSIVRADIHGVSCLIARTGYTGEDGFELYIPVDGAEKVFHALVEPRDQTGLTLCGLGCRDTLRLEAKFNLYGQDMDEETNPFEAGLGWVVKLDKKTPFIGQDALREIKAQGIRRRLIGMVVQGRQVIRQGYEIYDEGNKIGTVTSGSYSPTLEQSIGLGYIDMEHFDTTDVEVDVRGRRVKVALTKKPFYRRNAK